jgi:predicted transport protein
VSDTKLFALDNGTAREVAGTASALEKSLQTLIERNLEALLGIRLLASEYSTGPKHGGRIDTLGIDENGSPVIVEYKRATNENVINQGLFYLDWLFDHRAEFKLLVLEIQGKEAADAIDWSASRLLCIAGGFTRYDEHAVQQMNRNIELIRYRRFGETLLLLELVNAATADESALADGGPAVSVGSYKTISETLADLRGPVRDLYEELRAYLLALGDDVQEKALKYYVAFKRIKNFACVEVHPGKGCVTVFLKVDPASTTLEPGFTRDVREIGHFGTGDFEVTLRNREDLERAKPLFQESYEAS